MANGGLAFIDRRTGFNDIFDEQEAAFYSEPDEFYDKLRFFKQNSSERMKIAQNGYNKIHQEFNEKIVTQYMMDLLFQNPISSKNWHIAL